MAHKSLRVKPVDSMIFNTYDQFKRATTIKDLNDHVPTQLTLQKKLQDA